MIGRIALAALAAISLSACAGFDVNMRGWQVKGFIAAPLQTPLVAQQINEPRPTRVVRSYDREIRHIERVIPCHPPRELMREDPYYRDDYVWEHRELQRWIRKHCH